MNPPIEHPQTGDATTEQAEALLFACAKEQHIRSCECRKCARSAAVAAWEVF